MACAAALGSLACLAGCGGSRSSPKEEPRGYAQVANKPEHAVVVALADICFGMERESTGSSSSRPSYVLLPEWDEEACQKALGAAGKYERMFMLPQGASLDMLWSSAGFTLNMGGGGGSSKTYRYRPQGEPWLDIRGAVDGEPGGRGRPGSEVPCENIRGYQEERGERKKECRALFRYSNAIDESPERWILPYQVARSLEALWEVLARSIEEEYSAPGT